MRYNVILPYYAVADILRGSDRKNGKNMVNLFFYGYLGRTRWRYYYGKEYHEKERFLFGKADYGYGGIACARNRITGVRRNDYDRCGAVELYAHSHRIGRNRFRSVRGRIFGLCGRRRRIDPSDYRRFTVLRVDLGERSGRYDAYLYREDDGCRGIIRLGIPLARREKRIACDFYRIGNRTRREYATVYRRMSIYDRFRLYDGERTKRAEIYSRRTRNL